MASLNVFIGDDDATNVWTNPSDWTLGVPQLGQDLEIGSRSVVLNSDGVHFILVGGVGAGTFGFEAVGAANGGGGEITIGGSIEFAANTAMDVLGDTTLTGGGTIDLQEATGSSPAIITSTATSPVTLDNDDSITDFGWIVANGSLSVVNRGSIVEATISGFDGTNSTFTNDGTIVAAHYESSTINNVGGTIFGGGLDSGAVVIGGTVEGVAVNGAATLDGAMPGAPIDLVGDVAVHYGSLDLEGDYANDFTVGGGYEPAASLVLSGELTLSDDDTLTIEGSTSQVLGGAGGGVLDNVDGTILGDGRIGAGLTLINNGTIHPSGFLGITGSTLTIATGADVVNNGLLWAANETLVVDDSISGTGLVSVDDGVIEFNGAFDQPLSFENSGTVSLAASDSGVVSNFGLPVENPDFVFVPVTDTLVFEYASYAAGDYVTFAANGDAGGEVTVRASGGAAIASFNVASLYEPSQFVVQAGAGNTLSVSSGPGTTTPQVFNLPGQTVNLTTPGANVAYLFNAVSKPDTVTGSNGLITFDDALATITGGGDTIGIESAGNDVATLAGTNGSWDAVDGSNGVIDLDDAQATVLGGGDTIQLIGASGNETGLYDTSNAWDFINGSDATIWLTGARTSVAGALDTISLEGAGNAASLYDTNGHWDSAIGANGAVYFTDAQASVNGGGDVLYLLGNSGNEMGLYDTGNAWDFVSGSDATIWLNSALTSVAGALDTIIFDGAGDAASLYATKGVWDTISGANGTVYLTSAQASVIGAGNTISFSGTGDIVSIAGATSADAFTGTGGIVDVYGSKVSASGSNDTFNLFQSDALTVAGGVETFAFAAGIGGKDAITGFEPGDKIQLSKSDFANFAALSAHAAQSGANTVITLNAADTITLVGMAKASLTAAEFTFV